MNQQQSYRVVFLCWMDVRLDMIILFLQSTVIKANFEGSKERGRSILMCGYGGSSTCSIKPLLVLE